MKSIQLTQSQIKAVENGSTMLIFPMMEMDEPIVMSQDEFIRQYTPLQIGDKDVEYYIKSDIPYNELIIGTLKEILDVKIERVQDISFEDLLKMYTNETCDEDGLALYENVEDMCCILGIDYVANDYVFLVEFKR